MDLHDKTVYTAGWGKRFEFGLNDMRKVGSWRNPSKYSSCMTTIESPTGSKLKYCNTLEASPIIPPF